MRLPPLVLLLVDEYQSKCLDWLYEVIEKQLLLLSFFSGVVLPSSLILSRPDRLRYLQVQEEQKWLWPMAQLLRKWEYFPLEFGKINNILFSKSIWWVKPIWNQDSVVRESWLFSTVSFGHMTSCGVKITKSNIVSRFHTNCQLV